MNRPEQIRIDRFPIANAEFWLNQTAQWLAQPGHADQFVADLWPGLSPDGPPLQVIIAQAATALRDSLRDARDDLADSAEVTR